MRIEADSVKDYLSKVPEERVVVMKKLWNTIKKNIPKGFKACLNYGFPSFAVPHSIYPDGYHCDPKVPLPFVSIGSQKNFIALYHSGIYADPKLHDWFVEEYPKHCKYKLDMGKSCVRFKKMDDIPMDLIAELMQKVSVEEWIGTYEKNVKSK